MTDREELLQKLRDLRISEVRVEYSGSGDEGYIDEINFHPGEPEEHMRRLLDDFFWEEIIQMHHDGFHNDNGGYGTVIWNIEDDKLTLHHRDYIQDVIDHGEKEIE